MLYSVVNAIVVQVIYIVWLTCAIRIVLYGSHILYGSCCMNHVAWVTYVLHWSLVVGIKQFVQIMLFKLHRFYESHALLSCTHTAKEHIILTIKFKPTLHFNAFLTVLYSENKYTSIWTIFGQKQITWFSFTWPVSKELGIQ